MSQVVRNLFKWQQKHIGINMFNDTLHISKLRNVNLYITIVYNNINVEVCWFVYLFGPVIASDRVLKTNISFLL